MDRLHILLSDIQEIINAKSNIAKADSSDMTEFLEMAIAALKKIVSNSNAILNNIDLPRVKENLTEPWVLGMIAVIENNMTSIHDFVKFSEESDDTGTEASHKKPIEKKKKSHKTPFRVGFSTKYSPTQETTELNDTDVTDDSDPPSNMTTTTTTIAEPKPGLWDNIRKKKEREGKDYKPAKRGDPDRPDPEQWKKLTKDSKK